MQTQLPITPQLFQAVINSIPQHIFWKNREYVYLGCNTNFARVAGLESPNAIIGKTDYDLPWKKEDADFSRAADRRIMENDRPEYGIIQPHRKPDGKEAWVEINKMPLHDERGNVIGIVGAYRDITGPKLEEKIRHNQRMETVGRLAGGIAHDFNNMLAGIRGSADLLAKNKHLLEEDRELVDVILSTSTRASELTGKLLAFSRKGRTHSDWVNLHSILRNVVSILRSSISKQIQIETNLKATWAGMEGDSSELENTFLNLGLNARDAMTSGGTLRFTTNNVEIKEETGQVGNFQLGPGHYIVIQVCDTGIGMDEATIQHIFDPFYTTKPIGQGTGLGLAAAYGSVQEHGGAITVTSRENVGTTFEIHLPISHSIHKIRKKEIQPVLKGEGKILVVDDEDNIRRILRRQLQHLGYEVLEAENGLEGLRVYQEHQSQIDGVILDVLMPELGGRECFMKLRQVNAGLPVLMISGFSDTNIYDELRPFGLNGYLKKPFTLQELASELSEMLKSD